jgi:hypothetical protein
VDRNIKPQIISVSRRTDIPAYYADWFRKRLELGYTFYANPVTNKPVPVSLEPDDVKAFVFWTRNPKPLFKHLDYIDKKYNKHHYMLFTLNGSQEIIEKRNPKPDFAIDCVKYLADRYGGGYIQWRFDPIIVTSITPVEYIIDKFDEISGKIQGYTRQCIFSFVDLYKKTQRNIKKIEEETGICFYEISLSDRVKLIKNLKVIAESRNISLSACAEDEMLQSTGVQKAHCIDPSLINRICGKNEEFKYQSSRLGCGCIESRDIGYYDSCPHSCIYCYANTDPDKALINAKKYRKEGFPLDGFIK